MESYIDKTARLGQGVIVGRFAIVEDEVSIGNYVVVGDYVKILRGSVIGDGVRVGDGAIIGKAPVFAVTSTQKERDLTTVSIGVNSIIGTSAIVYTGSVMGSECFLGDRVIIRENCRVGDRTLIGAGVIVENDVSVGSNCKIQSGAYITAYTTLEDDVFIAPMVVTTNDNLMGRTGDCLARKQGPIIKRGARVGGGVVLLPGIEVAEETFIAAGAVVTANTRPGQLYMGVPARDIRAVSTEEYLNRGAFLGNSTC